VLKEEGFIIDYQVGQMAANDQGAKEFKALQGQERPPKAVLRCYLKYGLEGEKVIRRIERASRPGCRVYRHYVQLKPVLDGLGIAIPSPSRRVMSDRRARGRDTGARRLRR